MKHPAASCGVSGEILRSRYPPSPQPSPRFRWAAKLQRRRQDYGGFSRLDPPASYGVFGEGE